MDYNIYIHNVSGGTNTNTTPFQIQNNEGFSGSNDGAFSTAKSMAGFIENPDSLISSIKSTAAGGLFMAGGKAGLIMWAASKLIGMVFSVVSSFISIKTTVTGNTKPLNDFNNVSTIVKNILNPVGTAVQAQKAILEIRKANAKNEQNMNLYGGTVINNQYGRYL